MKTINQIIAFGLFFILFNINMNAQDIIHKRNGKTIQAKVVEVGAAEVKYKLFEKPDGPLYAVEKIDLQKIEFEDGRTEVYSDNFNNPDLYTHQRRQGIKVGFLAPLAGHTSFIYERNISPGRGFELKASIIGLGLNNDNREARGTFFSGGYKFYRTPDYYMKGMRYAHVMKGGYIKPEIMLGFYSENIQEFIGQTAPSEARRDVNFGAIMINLGKQWVFSDFLMVDFYTGLGYAFDNSANDDLLTVARHHFGVLKFGEGTNFAGTLGLNIGFLF